MKNLPDDELFDKLKTRLQNLEEQPENDVWDAIAANISTAEPTWIRRAEKLCLVLTLLLLMTTSYWASRPTGERTPGAVVQPTADASTQKESLDSPPSSRQSSDLRTFDASVGSDDEHKEQDSQAALSRGTLRTDLASQANRTQHDSSASTTSSVTGLYSDRRSPDHHSGNGLPIQHTSQTKDLAPPTEDTRVQASVNSPTVNDSPIFRQDSSPPDPPRELKLMADNVSQILMLPKTDSTTAGTVLPSKRAARQKAGMRIYAITTPALTFVDVQTSKTDNATFQTLNSPGILSKERLSFSLEAGTQLALSRRLVVFTGLTYFQQSMDLSLEQIESGSGSFSANGSLDFNFQPQTVTTIVQYRLQNVGVTAGLLYAISSGKILHQVGGSFQYEYGLLHRSSENTGQTSSFLHYRILYRAEYGINERLSIFVQPAFVRSLTYHDLMDGAIRLKQSRAGVGIGVVYKLGMRNEE